MKSALFTCVASVGLLGGLCTAQEIDLLSGYAKRSQAERPLEIAKAKREIDSLERPDARKQRNYLGGRLGMTPAQVNSRVRETARGRSEAIAAIQKRIAQLEDPLVPFYPAMPPLQTVNRGAIGLVSASVKVFQVIDGRNAIIEYDSTHDALWPAGVARPKPTMFWLVTDTEGMTDDSRYNVHGVLAATGTRTYASVAGSNTLLVLEAVDVSSHRKSFLGELRSWSIRGEAPIEAAFVRLDRRLVLKKPDGAIVNATLGDVDDASREYVAERQRVLREAR